MAKPKHMMAVMKAGESNDSPASLDSLHEARTKKKHARTWLITSIIVLIAGIVLISYPFVSSWLNQLAQNKVSATQESTVVAMISTDLSAEKERAIEFNKRLRDGVSRVIDPFDSNSSMPGVSEYREVLNIANDGVMGELIIPKISVDLPIYHFTTDDVLQHGVGHVVNTSVPIGGESTHVVLAGHTGLPTAQIFDRLEELQVGDWFIIRVLGEDCAYRVTSTEVVLPNQVNSLSIEPGKDQVTLVTCTPYGVNTHRLLVHAERTEVPSEWEDQNKLVNHSVDSPVDIKQNSILFALLGVVFAGIIVSIAVLVVTRTKVLSRKNK